MTKNIYLHAIVFDKKFVSGNLKGLTVKDQILTYPELNRTERLAAGLIEEANHNRTRKDTFGSGSYVITNVRMIPNYKQVTVNV